MSWALPTTFLAGSSGFTHKDSASITDPPWRKISNHSSTCLMSAGERDKEEREEGERREGEGETGAATGGEGEGVEERKKKS